jgi:hypothetical protein
MGKSSVCRVRERREERGERERGEREEWARRRGRKKE